MFSFSFSIRYGLRMYAHERARAHGFVRQMIGCDAPDCKIEWFHLNCVGLKTTPEGSWFCSQCEPKIKAQQQSRSRRK